MRRNINWLMKPGDTVYRSDGTKGIVLHVKWYQGHEPFAKAIVNVKWADNRIGTHYAKEIKTVTQKKRYEKRMEE